MPGSVLSYSGEKKPTIANNVGIVVNSELRRIEADCAKVCKVVLGQPYKLVV